MCSLGFYLFPSWCVGFLRVSLRVNIFHPSLSLLSVFISQGTSLSVMLSTPLPVSTVSTVLSVCLSLTVSLCHLPLYPRISHSLPHPSWHLCAFSSRSPPYNSPRSLPVLSSWLFSWVSSPNSMDVSFRGPSWNKCPGGRLLGSGMVAWLNVQSVLRGLTDKLWA